MSSANTMFELHERENTSAIADGSLLQSDGQNRHAYLQPEADDNTSDTSDSDMLPRFRMENRGGPCSAGNRTKTVKYISIAVAITLVVAFLGGCYLVYEIKKESKEEMTPGAVSSAQTGNSVIQIGEGGFIDRRFSFDTSECKGSDCSRCQTKVSERAHDYGQPFHCEEDERVINSSCFLCDTKCKSVDDLRNSNVRCRSGTVIRCCAITQMLSDYCGVGGKYQCYGDSSPWTPKCQCPFGKAGERCQEDKKATLVCECYNTDLKACGQESMQKCMNLTDFSSNMTCQMYADNHRNCRCRRKENDVANNDDDDDLDSCENPHTNSQVSNDCPKVSKGFTWLLFLLLMFQVTFLVDKR